jgi:1,4-alpha-glucan branching enzyme
MVTFRRILTAFLIVAWSGCHASAPTHSGDGRHGVRFSLRAPGASSVGLVGAFNRWDPKAHRLTGPGPDGVWTITISLPRGRYEYLFIINSTEWSLDPAAPFADDGLGGRNSVLVVPPD